MRASLSSTSALGKAVLAALGPAEQTRLLGSATLPALTPATITDRTTLRGHLEMLANRRYAVEDEEVATGVRAVAAAILDQRGQPLGAIGLSAPATRLSLERCLAVGSELIEAAARISGNLGLNPPERWSRPIVANVEASGVRQVIAASAYVGSSPTWSAKRRRLYWIDLARPVIHCSNPATGDDAVLALPAPAASVVLARDGLLASLQSGVQRVDPDTGRLRPLVDLIAPGGHQRYNSARCDRAGRLWITTMDVTTSRPSGCLYRVDRDGTATRMADQLLLPIGLAWSPDARWFYICDAPRREIYRYAFDVKRGTLSERRVFARVPEGSGRPTGLAVDAEGGIWNTQTDGWCVVRYDPDGGIERVVALPVPKPIDCCFGGTDLRTLFITTGRLGLPERRVAEVPWSGSVLAFDAPHAGVPTTAF
jgi:sugar lactone lactonase YvrE